MKLSELFPVEPKITLGGKDYDLIYSTRSIIALEREYPDVKEGDKTIETPQRIAKIANSMLTGVKAADLINILFVMLQEEGPDGKMRFIFPDKDSLIDLLEPSHFEDYCSAAFVAMMNARITDEQREKLEVLASQAKKKVTAEIMAQSIPSTVANADSAKKNTSTPRKGN